MKNETGDVFETLEDGDWLSDVSRSAWDRLIEKRGGCNCCISPPCSACCDPITEEELNAVGFTYGPNETP